jgi:hypothetical protein
LASASFKADSLSLRDSFEKKISRTWVQLDPETFVVLWKSVLFCKEAGERTLEAETILRIFLRDSQDDSRSHCVPLLAL